MQPLITICARKGSKGLPGKNTREFNGRPLIEWTIETAIEWGAGPVVISSDDEAVREIFSEYMHCDTYFDERPPELAMDDTPKLEVLRYVAQKTQEVMGNFDYVVDLDPTNPCRTIADLDKCRIIFEENLYKTLISVTNAKKNPYMNQLTTKSGMWATPCGNKYPITRRQAAPEVYDVNSNIYFYNTQWLLSDTTNFPVTDKTCIYLMESYAFCDIDNIVDFEVSGFLHRKYYE